MSCDIAISVKNTNKIYRIFDRPQDRLKQGFWRGKKQFYREFWALKDISFTLKKGETVGIIGRNGSGKSTLLQIIAGTLAPTSGDVEVNGRVAALLELGSGFNPEFTGRENVFLNASILGLSKEDIESRFEEIKSFADIGDFIDQPVKTYSSGMFVRLAFSVAVHSNPDILIVDEALSVGDALFQHKCIAKIKSLVNSGITLLFVSHSPEAIRALCKQGIWLETGQIKMIDSAIKVSNAYLNEVYLEHNRVVIDQLVLNESMVDSDEKKNESSNVSIIEKAKTDISDCEEVKINFVRVKNSQGLVVDSLMQGEDFSIEIQLFIPFSIPNFSVGILIKDELGIEMTGESVFNKYRKGLTIKSNQTVTVLFTSKLVLRGGQSYSIALRLNSVSKWDRSDNILLYKDETAAVFKIIADLDHPMWFRFYQNFEVEVNVE